MTKNPKFWHAYLEQHAKEIYGSHLLGVEALAAAFIIRHGIDPEEAEVVTTFDQGTLTWRSHIERKKRGNITR